MCRSIGEVKLKHLRDSKGVYPLLDLLVYHKLQFSAFVIYFLGENSIAWRFIWGIDFIRGVREIGGAHYAPVEQSSYSVGFFTFASSYFSWLNGLGAVATDQEAYLYLPFEFWNPFLDPL